MFHRDPPQSARSGVARFGYAREGFARLDWWQVQVQGFSETNHRTAAVMDIMDVARWDSMLEFLYELRQEECIRKVNGPVLYRTNPVRSGQGGGETSCPVSDGVGSMGCQFTKWPIQQCFHEYLISGT